mgnify:CR=1 FL=1
MWVGKIYLNCIHCKNKLLLIGVRLYVLSHEYMQSTRCEMLATKSAG